MVKKNIMKRTKSINKLIGGALLLIAIFFTSSCLKNGQYYTDFAAVGPSVDLPLAASTNNGVTAFSYPPSVTSVVLPIYVNLSSPNTLGKPVTATLALDTAGLNAYNLANGTSYVEMPDSVYTLSGTSINIPAGKRLDSITANINLSKLDLSVPNVLSITIQTASQPIEQWNHLFYYVAVKNQYDGIYTLTGYTLRAGDANRTGPVSAVQMPLVTSGSNSVTFGNLQPWADGTGVGIGNPQLSIDGSNNVTINSPGGAYNNPSYTFSKQVPVNNSKSRPISVFRGHFQEVKITKASKLKASEVYE